MLQKKILQVFITKFIFILLPQNLSTILKLQFQIRKIIYNKHIHVFEPKYSNTLGHEMSDFIFSIHV